MHAVDALAASLGRRTRGRTRSGSTPSWPATGSTSCSAASSPGPGRGCAATRTSLLVVRPDDLADWWEVALGPRPAVTTRRTPGDAASDEADWELTGGAVELYLRLWNRTAPPEEWRGMTAVTWSER